MSVNEPTTTGTVHIITASSQETTATSVTDGQSAHVQSAVTMTGFSSATFAGPADGDDEEDFYEEIDEDEDHEAAEAPDLPEEEPEEGRGKGQSASIGTMLVKGGTSQPQIKK